MFMFNREFWEQNKDRFARSYKDICPVARAVGYAEMTDHRFLTPDRDVQQTVFANGITITVNFGAAPYQLPDGQMLKPDGLRRVGDVNGCGSTFLTAQAQKKKPELFSSGLCETAFH